MGEHTDTGSPFLKNSSSIYALNLAFPAEVKTRFIPFRKVRSKRGCGCGSSNSGLTSEFSNPPK